MVSTKSTKTTVKGDEVVIRHHQVLRQSYDWQSAEVMYGIEMTVKNTPSEIQRGIDRAEEIIEERLIAKADTHRKLLRKLPPAKTT